MHWVRVPGQRQTFPSESSFYYLMLYCVRVLILVNEYVSELFPVFFPYLLVKQEFIQLPKQVRKVKEFVLPEGFLILLK